MIAVVVVLPQIFTALQGVNYGSRPKKYEELKLEIEMLKQERIVRP